MCERLSRLLTRSMDGICPMGGGNWFDALILDCLWFCHDKHFVIPGTEDMTKDYHDYWFHIKGALIGMLLGIPAALVAGIIAFL